MNLSFTDQKLKDCEQAFNQLNPEEAIYMTHYDLAKRTSIRDPDLWKHFLTDPKVSEWLSTEVETMRQVQFRRVLKNAGTNDRSVGAAQMLSALSKVQDSTQQKDGAIFVYCYTPLNEREQHAPNVSILRSEQK